MYILFIWAFKHVEHRKEEKSASMGDEYTN